MKFYFRLRFKNAVAMQIIGFLLNMFFTCKNFAAVKRYNALL